jgi:zinc/manganese transport system substrate-binding protein
MGSKPVESLPKRGLKTVILVLVIVGLVAAASWVAILLQGQSEGSGCGPQSTLAAGSGTKGMAISLAPFPDPSTGGASIRVVAAENFWGSLAAQVGGSKVNVTSVVSDPNTDPHEYESNPATARMIADADLVIVNGAGYDTWALSIISAEEAPKQTVLNVQDVLKQPLGANPHFWYSPAFVNVTVKAIYGAYVTMDPADAQYFHAQYASLNSSLWRGYMSLETQIKQKFAGSPVAATEDIFVYMANATGLHVVSPAGFMEAVAEGNDPSPQDVATMENLMREGNSTARVLVYNEQTVSPLTQTVRTIAAECQIPIVGITETVQPPGQTFQAWMGAEVGSLYDALNAY